MPTTTTCALGSSASGLASEREDKNFMSFEEILLLVERCCYHVWPVLFWSGSLLVGYRHRTAICLHPPSWTRCVFHWNGRQTCTAPFPKGTSLVSCPCGTEA